jgi:hypothetical protein
MLGKKNRLGGNEGGTAEISQSRAKDKKKGGQDTGKKEKAKERTTGYFHAGRLQNAFNGLVRSGGLELSDYGVAQSLTTQRRKMMMMIYLRRSVR